MTDNEKQLIREFFACSKKLHSAEIVRSDKIVGDIGEWLCVKKYGLILAESGRHPGFDGYIGNNKVQVKVHNSPKGTNLSVGSPEKYDILIVIIGLQSRLRHKNDNSTNSFLIYRFTKDEVIKLMCRGTGYYCAKKTLLERQYDSIEL